MLLVNVHACVCVYTSRCACAHENIKYKQHYMFSVYTIASLQAAQVINTSGVTCVDIMQLLFLSKKQKYVFTESSYALT